MKIGDRVLYKKIHIGTIVCEERYMYGVDFGRVISFDRIQTHNLEGNIKTWTGYWINKSNTDLEPYFIQEELASYEDLFK